MSEKNPLPKTNSSPLKQGEFPSKGKNRLPLLPFFKDVDSLLVSGRVYFTNYTYNLVKL